MLHLGVGFMVANLLVLAMPCAMDMAMLSTGMPLALLGLAYHRLRGIAALF